jgi:hypothetical protein
MSHLHIFTGNHTEHGRKTLSEIISIIQHGFAEIGTTVTFSDEYLLANTTNILFEYFLPGHKKVLESIKGEGINISLFATEIPSRKKFGVHYAGFNERYSPDWQFRFTAFEECVKYFDMIYTNVPSKKAQKYYKSFLPTKYVELACYIESLSGRKTVVPNTTPGFYGLQTPYRKQRIKELDPNLIWPNFMNDDEVDLWLESRSFVVSLKQHAGWQMQSPTRISRALHAGRFILLEEVEQESSISRALGSYSKFRYQKEYVNLKNDFKYLLEKTAKQLYTHKNEHPAERYLLALAKDFSTQETKQGKAQGGDKFFVKFPLP